MNLELPTLPDVESGTTAIDDVKGERLPWEAVITLIPSYQLPDPVKPSQALDTP